MNSSRQEQFRQTSRQLNFCSAFRIARIRIWEFVLGTLLYTFLYEGHPEIVKIWEMKEIPSPQESPNSEDPSPN